MTRKLIFLALITFINSFSVQAQRVYQYAGGTKVMAPSGINMRQNPGLKAKKNAAIPYGETVQIVDTLVNVFDTVDYIWTMWDGEELKRPVVGGWVKVRYKEKVGYVFTGLLGNFDHSENSPEIVIRDVGGACDYINFDMRKYHWYGLFQQETYTEIRKIKPTIYDFSEALPQVIYTSGEKQACLMMIASQKPLPAESLKRPGGLPVKMKRTEQPFKNHITPAFSLSWENDIQIEESEYKRLVLEIEAKKFPLEWSHYKDRNEYETILANDYSNVDLVYYGDINGDGYLDIILRTYNDYSKIYLFYGGSKRLWGVARFVHGPCC
ncbi:MAG: SH3 domain-containing protein [Bacteroidota bacterium]